MRVSGPAAERRATGVVRPLLKGRGVDRRPVARALVGGSCDHRDGQADELTMNDVDLEEEEGRGDTDADEDDEEFETNGADVPGMFQALMKRMNRNDKHVTKAMDSMGQMMGDFKNQVEKKFEEQAQRWDSKLEAMAQTLRREIAVSAAGSTATVAASSAPPSVAPSEAGPDPWAHYRQFSRGKGLGKGSSNFSMNDVPDSRLKVEIRGFITDWDDEQKKLDQALTY